MINWYLQNGKDSDVVVSSRIRLARNFNNIPFTTKFSKEQAQEVKNKVKEITPSIGYGLKFIDLNDLDDVTKISLIEKNLITAEFAMNKAKVGAILINDEENICIMINDEDHIRMQFFSSGLELENLKNLAVEIDEKIAKLLPYAVSKKYGYLTACPTNVGTAMKASVIVHLPALTMTNNIKLGTLVKCSIATSFCLHDMQYGITEYYTKSQILNDSQLSKMKAVQYRALAGKAMLYVDVEE